MDERSSQNYGQYCDIIGFGSQKEEIARATKSPEYERYHMYPRGNEETNFPAESVSPNLHCQAGSVIEVEIHKSRVE